MAVHKGAKMGILLCALVCAFAIPAWIPAIKHGPLSARHRASVIVFTFAAAVQLLFVVLVSIGILTLDYSLRFATAGVPCCVLATVLAVTDDVKSPVSIGVMVSSLLGLAMWLLLITLH
jgi:hypothetical protein